MSDQPPSPQGVDSLPEVEIRYTELSDGPYLKEWLMDPTIQKYFPMANEAEIDHGVQHWVGFSRYRCSITAYKDGKPCGLATLYLQPYKKLAHQCEFGIIVSPECRGMGVGTKLIKHLMHLAKHVFKIELLHLQVYSDNPAIRLYKRLGFRDFGRQSHWIKEADGTYVGRTFMERFI